MTVLNEKLAETYSERVVGFVDILGFKELVQRADGDKALREVIVEALGKVRSVAAPQAGATDFKAQNFSDCLILSAKPTPDGLWQLLLSIDALAWNLLQHGILIRGGVTIGGMHHDEQIVFGVGVIEAYRLESVVAKAPRMVVGRRAIQAATRFAAESAIWEPYKSSRLLRDTDGVWFLHYLNELEVFNHQLRKNPQMRSDPFYSVGQAIARIIQEKVDKTLDQPDVYAKFKWVAEYWNRRVIGLIRQGDNSLPVIKLAGQ